MPKLKKTRRERVGSEIFEIEYEEKKRTKLTEESLAAGVIFRFLTDLEEERFSMSESERTNLSLNLVDKLTKARLLK
jgi:hypothetical protein